MGFGILNAALRLTGISLCGLAAAVGLNGQSDDLLLKESFSREFSVHIGGTEAVPFQSIQSREFSLHVQTDNGDLVQEAVSREFDLAIADTNTPPPITQLSVESSSTGDEATLDWTGYNPYQYRDVSHFEIYVSASGAFSDVSGLVPYATVGGETTSTKLTGLTPFTDHYFAVVAVDALGNFDPVVNYSAVYVLGSELVSREFSLFVGEESPEPYRNIASRELSLAIVSGNPPPLIDTLNVSVNAIGDSAEIDWSGYNLLSNAPIDRFDIYLSDEGPIVEVSGLTPYTSIDGEATGVILDGLTPSTDHFFAVVPVDSLGNFDPVVNYAAGYVISPQVVSRELSVFVEAGTYPDGTNATSVSRELSIIVPDAAIPAPVTGIDSGFFVQTSTTQFGAVTLDFTSYNALAQNDIAAYDVYVQDNFFEDVSGLTPFVRINSESRIVTLSGLPGGSIQHFAVVAVDQLGNFDPSVRSFSAQASISGVGEVQNLTAESTADLLTFIWEAPEDAVSFVENYRVYFGDNDPVDLPLAQTTFSVSGLDRATGYTFRISTVDIFGNESPGTSVNASTWLLNPTDPLLSLQNGDVVLSWSGSEPASLVSEYLVFSAPAPFSDITGLTPIAQTIGFDAVVGPLETVAGQYFAVAAVNTIGSVSPDVVSVEANKQGQTITFPQPNLNGSEVIFAASASSGLPISYVIDNPAIGTLNGNTLVLAQGGRLSVTALQSGNDDYWQADPVTLELRIPPQIIEVTANGEAIEAGTVLDEIDELLRVTARDLDGVVAAEFAIRPTGGSFVSLGRDEIPGNGLTSALALDVLGNGDFELQVTVETPEGISNSVLLPITIQLAPPAPPIITQPTNNSTFDSKEVIVSGTATRDASVSILRNGVEVATGVTVNSEGIFTATIDLLQGLNELTAGASNGVGASAPSEPVAATLRSKLELEMASEFYLEQDTIDITVSRNHDQGAVTVQFSESVFGQLNLPAPLVIPDGQLSATTQLTVIDDEVPELESLVTLSARASGYLPGSSVLTIVDDDRPTLTLSLNRTTISESATSPVVATISRQPVTSYAVTVSFLSNLTGEVQIPASTVIPAFVESIDINILPNDNDELDGDRAVSLLAQFVDVTTLGSLADSNEAQLTITDDDGPALSLAFERDLVIEGDSVPGTIERNSGLDQALIVSLTSSDSNQLSVPAEVVFLPGNETAQFFATATEDGIPDGNQPVLVSAEAVGFSSAEVRLVTTDETGPDLTVTQLIHPDFAQTEDALSFSYRIENQGTSTFPGPLFVRSYLSTDATLDDSDELISEYALPSDLAADLYFERAESVFTPRETGEYFIIVDVDPFNVTNEILEDNNLRVSSPPVLISPAYEAVVSADVTTAPTNTPIRLSGVATNVGSNTPAPFKLVNIHLSVRNTTRIISALTDSNGQFEATFTPLQSEGGAYTVGAAHPGVDEAPVQDSFTLLGFSSQVDEIEETVTREGEVTTGSIQIANLADLQLSAISVQGVGFPSGISLTGYLAGDATTLAPLDETEVIYEISATSAAPAEAQGTLRIVSTSGAQVDIPVSLTLRNLESLLVYEGGRLERGMVPGTQAFVNFTVRNEGSVSTGPLRIILPQSNFLTAVTASPTAALAPGEKTTISLSLCPPEDITLTAFNGTLQVAGDDNTVNVPFTFRAISDATGDLVVSTENEYTYYAEGNPPLADATVTIIDAIDGTEVASGITAADGILRFEDLREGYYTVGVRADKHTRFEDTIYIEPARETSVRAFLSRQTVEYIWNVVPTEIEDRYRIVVETVFETNVPAPVVTVEPTFIDLEALTEDVTQIDMTFTNHGLIAANDVGIQFNSTSEWKIESIASDLGTLAAKSKITVPVTITRLSGGDRGDCGSPSGTVDWKFLCGDICVFGSASVAFNSNRGDCSFTPRGSGGGGGAVLSPSPVRGGSVGFCDPCLLKVLFKCSCLKLPLNPVAKCIISLAGADDALGLLGGAVSCACSLAKTTPATAAACCAIKCLIEVKKCSDDIAANSGRSNGNDVVARFQEEADFLGDLYGVETVILGSEDWYLYADDEDFVEWAEAIANAVSQESDGALRITAAERSVIDSLPFNQRTLLVSPSDFIDRWNNTIDNYENDIFEPTAATGDFISLTSLQSAVQSAEFSILRAESLGFDNALEPFFNAYDDYIAFYSDTGGGVCARVELKLEQEAVMTRDAFNATLDIINNDISNIEQVGITLTIRDSNGVDATDAFGIREPETSGVSNGIVSGETTGSWSWILIPTQDAAPTEPVIYTVEGSLSYVQDGQSITVPLAPQPITVYPNPNLRLKYFHQRDVFSDDPHTDIIEPSQPFVLGVMVENTGAGVARNLRIISSQPEIVENEKGLLIDFAIIATEVSGQNLTPGLTADFGDLAAGQIKVGRWLMTSTLQGLFIDYEASFEHLDDLNNERLSLIESVEIHETIRQIEALAELDDGLPDFLTNDVPDFRDLPDTIHLSDGTTVPVAVSESATAGTVSNEQLTVTLTAPELGSGWSYLRIPDPADGAYRLVSVERSDGLAIPLDSNVWITDRTFIGLGSRPIRENILHLVDNNSTGSYELTYVAILPPDVTAPSSTVTALPATSGSFIEVSWSGSDDREIAAFDIYVSVDGGPFELWLENTRQTTALYQGESGSNYEFFSRASDTSGNVEALKSAADTFTITSLTNQAPVITPIDDIEIEEGGVVSLRILADDPDGPNNLLQFGLIADHPGITLNASSGLLRWSTGELDGGTSVAVTVQVTDGNIDALTTTESFTITVLDINQNPSVNSLPSYAVNVGDLLTVQVVAEDSDLPTQTLSYSLLGTIPFGMSIDSATGELTWTPMETHENQSFEVEIVVSDDYSPSGQQSATLFVDVLEQPGLPPEFTSPPTVTWFEGASNSMTISAVDPENETVNVNADVSGLPGWAEFYPRPDSGEGLFVWETSGVATGSYEISVRASTALQFTDSVMVFEIVPRMSFSDFSGWQAAYGINPASDPLNDSNADDIPDLMAYALGIDPIGGVSPAQPNPTPNMSYDAGSLSFTFAMPKVIRPDLRYRVLETEDLKTDFSEYSVYENSNWIGVSPDSFDEGSNKSRVIFPVTLGDGETNRFFILEVELIR